MTISNEKIAEIMQQSPTAEAFSTYAACRERNVREGISRLPSIRAQMTKEGFNPVPQDLLTMFKELDRAGVGKLLKDEFKWNISIRDVGVLAGPQAPLPPKREVSKKTLVICFGENKDASISFTNNLTKEDIQFLASKMLQDCK